MSTKSTKLPVLDKAHQIDLEELIELAGGRPLVKREIDKIHPQAVVDHTQELPASFEHEPVSGPVATPRCDHCFGVMPCSKHANVQHLDITTSLDISPTSVLAGAHNADLECVVVIGITKEGREYFASSVADAAEGVYYAMRAVHNLNKVVDGEYDNECIGPGKPAA